MTTTPQDPETGLATVERPPSAGTASRTRPAPPTFATLVGLVARREVVTAVRSKAFLISTGVLVLLVLGGIVGQSFLGGRLTTPPKVATVAAMQAQVQAAGLTPVLVADADAARADVRAGTVAAAVLPGDDGRVLVVGLSSTPESVVQAMSVPPKVELLGTQVASTGVRYAVTIGFGIIFMMVAMIFGQTIAQNTVVEKQTRVVEILLSAVPSRALLAGKVLGNAALALGQVALLAAAAVLGLVVTGQDGLLGAVGAPVAWFVVFFAVGFLLFACVFAASAALVSRQEDLGAVLQPATWLVMLPYVLVVAGANNHTLMAVASYVPFTAPVAMPVRLFTADAAWWEPLLSLAVLLATAGVLVVVAARVYERSVLRMGARVRIREVLGRRSAAA